MKTKAYALVTGGSEGIGRAIAGELALRGYGLLLVALPEEKLFETGKLLMARHNVPVVTKGVDLSKDGADLEIFQWVSEGGWDLEILVNNAGFGQLGPFSVFDRDFYHRMVHVNVVNMVGLTRLLLPNLQNRKPSFILNVGSIASFFPMPYKSVYASTKYFVYSFSRALREELRKEKVSVSILCPGAVFTNASVQARIASAGYLATKTTLSATKVGRIAVKGMLRGKWLIMPGISSKLAYHIKRWIPCNLMQRMLARKFGNHGNPVQI